MLRRAHIDEVANHDAAEIALQIVKAGYTVHSELDWDVEEVNIGDPADVAE
jgi:hypothetical protein